MCIQYVLVLEQQNKIEEDKALGDVVGVRLEVMEHGHALEPRTYLRYSPPLPM